MGLVANSLAWAWLPHLWTLPGTRKPGAKGFLCANETTLVFGAASEALGSGAWLRAHYITCAAQKGR